MDKKSAISQRRTEKPKLHQRELKDVVHETFQIDNSDFPSLHDTSVKTGNHNKNSPECNKTSFSYSDKLKAPPQERTSNFFKFGNEFKDFNKKECSSHHSQLSLPKNNLSQTKHNTKEQYQSNSNAFRGKRVQNSFEAKNCVPSIQTGLSIGRSQLPSKCQQPIATSSSADTSQEGLSGAEGWTLYVKHSSKHMHDKNRGRNNPEMGFRADCKDVERAPESPCPKYKKKFNPTDKNQSSRHLVSKGYEITSAKNEGCKTSMHREVPYNSKVKLNNTKDKLKDLKVNSEIYTSSSSTMHAHGIRQTLYTEPKSDDRNRMRNYDKNILANHSLGNPEISSVSSSTTQNVLQQMPLSGQQMHNVNRISSANTSRNNYPSSSLIQNHPNSDHRVSGRHNKGQHSEQVLSESTATKTKKKRKSKVKRQAALQAGKILILTPEAHSKILNQANSTNRKSQSMSVTNINDDEEYPELGIGVIPKNNKEIPVKTGGVDSKAKLPFSSNDNGLQVDNDEASTSVSSINHEINKGSGSDINAEKVINTEAGIAHVPVHSSNQITVSLFDMLSTKKSKKKEIEDKVLEEDTPVEHSPVKIRTKKVFSQPVNPLASSKPTVKRGKEREQPKAKKPSKMRKLILLGRKAKKENVALKGADIHFNDQSDVDTDAFSDGSTVSPSKSPIYGETDFGDSDKTNSFAMNTDVLEGELTASISNCGKLLPTDAEYQESKSLSSPKQSNDAQRGLPKATLYTIDSTPKHYKLPTINNFEKIVISSPYDDVSHKLDPQMKDTSECKILVSNVESENFVTYYNTFDEQKAENNPDRQTIDYVDQTCVKSMKLDMYFTTLIQSIFDDCMAEMKSKQSKVPIEKKVNGVKGKMPQDLSRDTLQLKIPSHLKNKIDTNCNDLALSILGDCLSDLKILQNENLSCLDLSEKSTSGCGSLPGHNFSEVEDIALLSESTKFNIEELTENNYCDINNDKSKNASEKSEHVMNTKAVSSCTLNCPTIKNSDCELKISDAKLELLSLNSDKAAVQINPELPQSKFSDLEKMEAAKILLHTRRFRDYCTHFVTKDLDMTVFTLLDDLARFQDRMHQKDPVKARMKRRLMYGIKEIKKHLTLKKLKGIIIATDIEDNKTEGGLNDLLKELISLSEAYHIPYVFSHKRFNLGKVCRKPAPVSCVGILNYEGSEKNFKKMLELKEESQYDYTMVTKEIVQLLTDDHIMSLLETVQKSIVPYEISKFIMKELFGNDLLGEENLSLEFNVKSEIANLKLDTKVLSSVIKSDKNCTIIEDHLENYKIHTILKKYNVIKT